MEQSNVIDGHKADGHGMDLLGPLDPSPIDSCHAASTSEVLLLCEHAGQAIPQALNGLGLPQGVIDQHIGWDIGAESLARAVSDHLNCPLIIQRYSRLVMDCNRPPGSEGSIPETSDSVPIPGNVGLTPQDHGMRRQAIFDPMNDAITSMFASHPRRAVFSIHSFTPEFSGRKRPWDAGFLTRRDTATADLMMTTLSQANPALTLGLNQPYQIEDASDWFIPRHAEAREMRHALIEIRNDHLRDTAGVADWADLLVTAICAVLEDAQ